MGKYPEHQQRQPHGVAGQPCVDVQRRPDGVQYYLQRHNPEHPLADARRISLSTPAAIVTTSLIKCANGETIRPDPRLHHAAPVFPRRPHSGLQGHLDGGQRLSRSIWRAACPTRWMKTAATDRAAHLGEPQESYLKKPISHPLWKEYEEFGLRGGHGGMDYLVLRAFVESVQNGTRSAHRRATTPASWPSDHRR